jgi:ABC-type protease/lipase transport system fused ATPase/permease subunit
VLTSLTGFGFPISGFTPGLAIGALSLLVLALAIYARYGRHLAGAWRRVYVVCAVVALYFNVLVLIVQSFQKVEALKSLAPKQSEPPFVATQLIALVALIVLGTLAAIRFRDRPVHGQSS